MNARVINNRYLNADKDGLKQTLDFTIEGDCISSTKSIDRSESPPFGTKNNKKPVIKSPNLSDATTVNHSILTTKPEARESYRG